MKKVWNTFLRVAKYILVIGGVSQFLFWGCEVVNKLSTPLKATISYGDTLYPSDLRPMLSTLEKDIITIDVTMKYSEKSDDREKLSESIRKVGDNFTKLSTRLDVSSYYFLKLENTGNSRCGNVQIFVPNTSFFCVVHNGTVLVSGENQNTIKIPEILPKDKISIFTWDGVGPSDYKAQLITILYDSGVAKISILKPNVGYIGRLVDKICPNIYIFIFEIAWIFITGFWIITGWLRFYCSNSKPASSNNAPVDSTGTSTKENS